MKRVSLNHASMRFKSTTALNALSVEFEPGEITALLGRNGAGKTTLLSVVSGLLKLSEGDCLYENAAVFENAQAMNDIAFAYKKDYEEETQKVKRYVKNIAALRDNFDISLCHRYLNDFKVSLDKRVNQLSSGQQSALEIALALAANTSVVLFDEIHVGMDAHLRESFYQTLLDAQATHPRTMIISTHYIDEMRHLFDRVSIIEKGELIVHNTQENLLSEAVLLSGPREALKAFNRAPTLIGCKEDTTFMQCAFTQEPNHLPSGVSVTPLTLQQYFLMLSKEDNHA